jgi:aspartyl/asparaginyl-tRNA synthetase
MWRNERKWIQQLNTDFVMAFNEIAFTVITVLMSVIGYFLKALHTDLKAVIEEQKKVIETQGRLKGKIELVDNESRFKYEAIEKMTQLEIKHLAEQISELTQSVKKLIEVQLTR